MTEQREWKPGDLVWLPGQVCTGYPKGRIVAFVVDNAEALPHTWRPRADGAEPTGALRGAVQEGDVVTIQGTVERELTYGCFQVLWQDGYSQIVNRSNLTIVSRAAPKPALAAPKPALCDFCRWCWENTVGGYRLQRCVHPNSLIQDLEYRAPATCSLFERYPGA